MSAHQRADLHNSLIGEVGSTVAPATSESGDTQVRTSVRKRGSASTFARSIQERAIADRDLFRQILSLERKRSERSGQPFMLALLHMNEMLEGLNGEGKSLLLKVQRGIASTIRDTDVVGWCEEEEPVLGILFTQVVEPNLVIATAIMKRITEAISKATAPEQAAKMDITCYMFQGRESQIDKFESILVYPDLLLQPRQRSANLT
jgi:GGDEF domain-containing protein